MQYGFLISEYKEKPDDPYYKQYVSAWFAYYQRTTGVRPRFDDTSARCSLRLASIALSGLVSATGAIASGVTGIIICLSIVRSLFVVF